MGHQSYVLLCSKMTSFQPSEGEFSEKSEILQEYYNFKILICIFLKFTDRPNLNHRKLKLDGAIGHFAEPL